MASASAPPSLSLPATPLDGLSDKDLTMRLAGGDEAAFETLYARHAQGLLGFCRHLLGSREEAEDAVQQVFMQAYRQIARGDAPERLRPWLYAAARNRCISMRRARGEVAVAPVEPATEGLDKQVERMADVRALLRDLHRLPEDQRTALVLFEFGDLSQADIAEVLACDSSRVKSLVFRARSNLLAAREARDASCSAIRRELSVARGGELNSGALRRHLDGCESCTLFLEQVRRQRRALGLLVPVVPVAGLYARAAEASAAAKEGGSGWLFGGRRAHTAAAGAAVAVLVLAAVLGMSATGDGQREPVATPPASAAEARPASEARGPAGGGGPPPTDRGRDAGPAPSVVSPSIDAYETDGPGIQARIGEGGGSPTGAVAGSEAAGGADAARSGSGSGAGLPFTGQDLAAIVAAGLLLLGLGLFLRRLTPTEEA
jgi:RNA polymerase sigma factor (sigma-70 family)